MTYVIPQGSVLGSTLFVLFNNYLPQVVGSPVALFADDTKMLRKIQSDEDGEKLQQHIHLHQVPDIHCHIDSSQCLAQLTSARDGTHSHTYVWESFHTFIMARQRPFCTLIRFKLLQVDQGSSVPRAKCSLGMIPLSHHSVNRSPGAFHSSTHNVVRASCFEVLSASVESMKLFLDGSMCLAGRWPWSGCIGSSSWR